MQIFPEIGSAKTSKSFIPVGVSLPFSLGVSLPDCRPSVASIYSRHYGLFFYAKVHVVGHAWIESITLNFPRSAHCISQSAEYFDLC